MAASKFGNLRLKQDTINYLKRLKLAFEIADGGAPMTNDDFIAKLVEAVQEGNKPIWEAFNELNKTIDCLGRKLAEERKRLR